MQPSTELDLSGIVLYDGIVLLAQFLVNYGFLLYAVYRFSSEEFSKRFNIKFIHQIKNS